MDGSVLVVAVGVGFFVEVDFCQARRDSILCGLALSVEVCRSKGCFFYFGGVCFVDVGGVSLC